MSTLAPIRIAPFVALTATSEREKSLKIVVCASLRKCAEKERETAAKAPASS